MPSKLALFGATGPHKGPWQRADGSENHVELLGPACDVVLECNCENNSSTLPLSTTSTLPFPSGVKTYRVILRDTPASAVTVRVHFN